jgi:hypothetical protein
MPEHFSGMPKSSGEAEAKNRRFSLVDPFNLRLRAHYF